jgi:carboxymethylenebutenolidase
VNSHIRNVADRLAQQGYVAIAPELFHRTAPGFDGDYANFPSVMPHIQAITIPGVEADLQACFEWLRQQPHVEAEKICSIGFCMGGRISFLANSILPLRAAVSFYGSRIAPGMLDRAATLHAPMLFFWGGRDANITAEVRRSVTGALDAAKKSYVSVEFSDADHGYFNDQRGAYHALAARQSWSLMLEFLRSHSAS